MGAAAEGDDRLVLEEEQRVADLAADARFDQALLQRERVCVPDAPEPVGGDLLHGDPSLRAE